MEGKKDTINHNELIYNEIEKYNLKASVVIKYGIDERNLKSKLVLCP